MTLLESSPHEMIRIKLEFMKPFKAINAVEFTFLPDENGGTHVTWALSGQNSFQARLIGVFMNMDEMVGRDFEKGLAAMKTVVEARS